MAILLFFAGIFFLILLNITFNRPWRGYPPHDPYYPYPDRYYRDEPYLPMRLFSERFAALLNTLLFVLLLAIVIVFFGSSAR